MDNVIKDELGIDIHDAGDAIGARVIKDVNAVVDNSEKDTGVMLFDNSEPYAYSSVLPSIESALLDYITLQDRIDDLNKDNALVSKLTYESFKEYLPNSDITVEELTDTPTLVNKDKLIAEVSNTVNNNRDKALSELKNIFEDIKKQCNYFMRKTTTVEGIENTPIYSINEIINDIKGIITIYGIISSKPDSVYGENKTIISIATDPITTLIQNNDILISIFENSNIENNDLINNLKLLLSILNIQDFQIIFYEVLQDVNLANIDESFHEFNIKVLYDKYVNSEYSKENPINNTSISLIEQFYMHLSNDDINTIVSLDQNVFIVIEDILENIENKNVSVLNNYMPVMQSLLEYIKYKTIVIDSLNKFNGIVKTVLSDFNKLLNTK